MASVMRRRASTVALVLRAKQIHTFAFAPSDLEVIIAKKVRGYLAASISLYVLFSVQRVFHIVPSKETSHSYPDRIESLLLHFF